MIPSTLEDLYTFLRWTPGKRPLIAAHRGGPEPGEAENGLSTFERALGRGATFIEIDVRRTRDGVYVLHHDAALDRCTTGRGPLADHTLEELRHLRLRDLTGRPTDHAIPTLAETIAWIRGRGLLYVDVKPPVTYEEVQRFLCEQDALAMSVTLTYDIRDTLAVYAVCAGAMIYAMVPDERRVRELLAAGIPTRQLVASVQEHTPGHLYDALHRHGITIDYPCWAGTDRRARTEGWRAYLHGLSLGAGLFNTDDVGRVGEALAHAGTG